LTDAGKQLGERLVDVAGESVRLERDGLLALADPP
jgi:hypothetical protein